MYRVSNTMVKDTLLLAILQHGQITRVVLEIVIHARIYKPLCLRKLTPSFSLTYCIRHRGYKT